MAAVESWRHTARPPPPGARTLWVGDLEDWMDETWMWHTFGYGATVTSVKVKRDAATGQSAGFGFVEFPTTFEAEQVLIGYQGKAIAGHPDGKVYKLNWAAADGEAPHTRARPKDYPVFVGDLSEEINDQLLLGAFYPKYSTVTSAKVVMDKGYPPRSKGFGFVRFSDDSERHRAIAEMNGAWLGTKMMRVSEAQSQREDRGSDYRDRGPRDDEPFGHQPDRGRAPKADDLEAAQDATNTTLFIGGLDPNVTDHVLSSTFAQFGTIIYCRVPEGKAIGFVQFDSRQAAEQAMQTMNNTFLMGGKIRVNWGKAGVGKGARPIGANTIRDTHALLSALLWMKRLINRLYAGVNHFTPITPAAVGLAPPTYPSQQTVPPAPPAPKLEEEAGDIVDDPKDPGAINEAYLWHRGSKFDGFMLHTLTQEEMLEDPNAQWDRFGSNLP